MPLLLPKRSFTEFQGKTHSIPPTLTTSFRGQVKCHHLQEAPLNSSHLRGNCPLSPALPIPTPVLPSVMGLTPLDDNMLAFLSSLSDCEILPTLCLQAPVKD